MVKPYSIDLRIRAVDAMTAGATARVVAAGFDLAVSLVIKWHQRCQKAGSVTPGKMGGHRKPVLDPIEQTFVKIKHWMRIAQNEPSKKHGNTSENSPHNSPNRNA